MKLILDHDGATKRCILFDRKSYVMEDFDGNLTIKGNTLNGRSNEQFTLQFINDCVQHVLNEQPEKMQEEYERWKMLIESQLLTVDQVKKRQTLNQSLDEYKNKLEAGQNPIPQYEAALHAERTLLKGDIVETWIEEPQPIEKVYKTRENKMVIPNKSSYEKIRLTKHFNGNIDRKHYIGRLDSTTRKLLVVTGLDNFKKWFKGVTIRKTDKAKLINVVGMKEFNETFPDFRWTSKYVDDLNQKQKQEFNALGLTFNK